MGHTTFGPHPDPPMGFYIRIINKRIGPKNISVYVKRYLHELLKRKSLKNRKTAVFCVLGGPGKRPYFQKNCLIVSGITLSESLDPFLSDSIYYSTIQNEFFFRGPDPTLGTVPDTSNYWPKCYLSSFEIPSMYNKFST